MTFTGRESTWGRLFFSGRDWEFLITWPPSSACQWLKGFLEMKAKFCFRRVQSRRSQSVDLTRSVWLEQFPTGKMELEISGRKTPLKVGNNSIVLANFPDLPSLGLQIFKLHRQIHPSMTLRSSDNPMKHFPLIAQLWFSLQIPCHVQTACERNFTSISEAKRKQLVSQWEQWGLLSLGKEQKIFSHFFRGIFFSGISRQ